MKKILIIEDEEIIRNELKTLLENSGYEVVVLENFNNIKEYVKNTKTDLLLLDINLPNANGEMLLKEIRKESNIPIIIVTSRVGEVDEVLSISYGADDYITKPYNPTILLLRIQNIFKRMETTNGDMNYDGVSVNPQKGTLEQDGKILELTKNEMIIQAITDYKEIYEVVRDIFEKKAPSLLHSLKDWEKLYETELKQQQSLDNSR